MFRLFVDGRTEAIAITDWIRFNREANHANPVRVMCFHNGTPYGTLTANEIASRLAEGYEVDRVDNSGLSTLDVQNYSTAIAVGFDQDLREFFGLLKDQFSGVVLGTTTLSVPDWQQLVSFDDSKVDVMHTAVSGFEEDTDFVRRLNAIDVDTVAKRGAGLILPATIQRLHADQQRYDAYRHIRNNYISAFCEDCIRLFALASRHGQPTLRALLDNPRFDETRRSETIIRDLDFGVTGDANVNVAVKKVCEKRRLSR